MSSKYSDFSRCTPSGVENLSFISKPYRLNPNLNCCVYIYIYIFIYIYIYGCVYFVWLSETRHAANRVKVLVSLAWDVDGILVRVLAGAMVPIMVGHMAP